MKKLFLIGLVLVLITGCGASPQEKRNNYDACLIEKKREFWLEINEENPNMYPQEIENYREMIENALPGMCVDNLK